MRRRFVAASWVLICACGARSEIAGTPIEGEDDAAAADATLDVAHMDAAPHADASSDAADASLDAGVDSGLCCDLGFKQSGCQQCGTGDTCWEKIGSCGHDEPKCGPSNCEGCCLGATLCADGTEVGGCGNGGQLCQTCFDSKNKLTACVKDDAGAGGTCAGGPTCTKQNCFEGCCNGDVCMVGNADTLCGFGAVVCADCAKLGGFCDAGVCQTPHQ